MTEADEGSLAVMKQRFRIAPGCILIEKVSNCQNSSESAVTIGEVVEPIFPWPFVVGLGNNKGVFNGMREITRLKKSPMLGMFKEQPAQEARYPWNVSLAHPGTDIQVLRLFCGTIVLRHILGTLG